MSKPLANTPEKYHFFHFTEDFSFYGLIAGFFVFLKLFFAVFATKVRFLNDFFSQGKNVDKKSYCLDTRRDPGGPKVTF